MGQAVNSQGESSEFRVRPNVLLNFAQTWATRHGTNGGFSITKFSERIKNRVKHELDGGTTTTIKINDGNFVDIVDLSDVLSGYVYYAVTQSVNGRMELVNIVDESLLEEMVGPVKPKPASDGFDDVDFASANPVVEASNSKKLELAKDELVLLQYIKGDDEVTCELKRGGLQAMILKLLADGILLDTMKVWSHGRRPQIDVTL